MFNDNGLPYVVREFPKFKFKGKGHEVSLFKLINIYIIAKLQASDLKYLLKQYELWANRVYPKYTFKDFVKRVEGLGRTSKEFKVRYCHGNYLNKFI